MTVLLQYDAAGLANGSAIVVGTAGNGDTAAPSEVHSAWSIVTGSDQSYPRLRGVQAASTAGNLAWTGYNATTLGLRVMYSPSLIASSSNTIIEGVNPTGGIAFRVDQAGTGGSSHLRIRDAAGTQNAEGTVAIAGGSVYWLQLTLTPTALVLYVYDQAGHLIDTITGASTYGTVKKITIGPFLATPTLPAMDFAHLLMTDQATQPGLPFTPPSVNIATTWWDGTAEHPVKLTWWDGASEQPISLDIP
jgi:hypothetical protein